MKKEIIYPRPPEEINKHLDISDIQWKAKTRKGSWNIEKLNLNSEINVTRRNDRIRIRNIILRLKKILEDYRRDPKYHEKQAEFDNEIFMLEQ
ncbi:hypothetical protein [Legionella rowbothamii]|uniref:hypothetical protein n=1 Tax=Legionella rowbothamii TaxID=96229 RepID=UPI001F5F50F5|nr:hypothetical protein [Legionella rowbothamii]